VTDDLQRTRGQRRYAELLLATVEVKEALAAYDRLTRARNASEGLQRACLARLLAAVRTATGLIDTSGSMGREILARRESSETPLDPSS